MHAIDMSNDRANMVYVGDTPWHHLGTRFTGKEDFDQWRIAAGFGWHAAERPLLYQEPHAVTGQMVNVALPSHKAIVRDDTGLLLGVVGKDYKTVQPREVLEFFRDIAFASDSRYEMETAGCLFDGKRVWALAKLAREIRIAGTDAVKPYLLFGTGFDGKTSSFADYTSVRVVCNNTLEMAVGLGAANASIRIPHSSVFDEDAVKRALGLIASEEDATIEAFETTANTLAHRTSVTDEEAFNFFAQLYGPKPEEGKTIADLRIGDFTTGQRKAIGRLMKLFEDGPGAHLRSAERTAWGLVNSVTHYEDHDRGSNETKRLQSAQFGAGSRRKRAAVDAGLALAA